jgi:hypothetical protein
LSKGPVLLQCEVEEAAKIRREWGLSWRRIAQILKRDHRGLMRGVQKLSRESVDLSPKDPLLS